jgi:hypothetical protein
LDAASDGRDWLDTRLRQATENNFFYRRERISLHPSTLNSEEQIFWCNHQDQLASCPRIPKAPRYLLAEQKAPSSGSSEHHDSRSQAAHPSEHRIYTASLIECVAVCGEYNTIHALDFFDNERGGLTARQAVSVNTSADTESPTDDRRPASRSDAAELSPSPGSLW